MANFVASASTESPALPAELACSERDRLDSSLLAELTWSVLPAALQRSLGESHRVWICPDQQSYVGISIYEDEGSELSSNGSINPPHHRLRAWALVCDDESDPNSNISTRLTLFECVNSSAPGGQAGQVSDQNGGVRGLTNLGGFACFRILNGRPDRLSVDVKEPQSDYPICRLTYVIAADGRPIWWADSVLPGLLDLPGGRYELSSVKVNGLTVN